MQVYHIVLFVAAKYGFNPALSKLKSMKMLAIFKTVQRRNKLNWQLLCTYYSLLDLDILSFYLKSLPAQETRLHHERQIFSHNLKYI